eukprot:PITA_05587
MEEDSSNIILGGDLNLILHANEKRGGSFTPDPFRSQLEIIMQNGELIDIIPKNRKYTWSNRGLGSNNIMERLGRTLSNHLIYETYCPLGPLPFKFSQIWSDYQTARSLIQQTWSQHVEGSPGFIWENKLKNVKKALKTWAKTQYNEPEGKKREVKAKIEEFQCAIDNQEYHQDEKVQEEDLYNQLYRIKREEEEKWRIKSRQTWLKSGDKNTSFFHKQATAQQIKNNISAITDNARIQHSDQTAIKGAASDHFKELLTETGEEELFDNLL